MAQTECLLEETGNAILEVCVRFLQFDGESVTEKAFPSGSLSLRALADSAYHTVLRSGPLEASFQVTATRLEGSFFKISARVANVVEVAPPDRDTALTRSLLSTHIILSIREGRFLSMTEPPEPQRARAGECRNVGLWPVLAGKGDAHMLAAPFTLYDHPKIAPQSPGDLFDGTEIDELLTLRILTLTDEEKREMRNADGRTRALLERTERLTDEALWKLHGAAETPLRFSAGERVRLRPRAGTGARTDILDLVLNGALATVLSMEEDFDGRTYVCVVLESDPGKDLGAEGKPGHRFFFAPEELERVG